MKKKRSGLARWLLDPVSSADQERIREHRRWTFRLNMFVVFIAVPLVTLVFWGYIEATREDDPALKACNVTCAGFQKKGAIVPDSRLTLKSDGTVGHAHICSCVALKAIGSANAVDERVYHRASRSTMTRKQSIPMRPRFSLILALSTRELNHDKRS